MNVIIKQLELIDRIDQLIRLEATGNSIELASRLGISKTKLYRIINTMKALNAPVEYDIALESFVYVNDVGFRFGFFTQELSNTNIHPYMG